MTDTTPANEASLLDVLDRVLGKGVFVAGELTISVADVDLLYVGLQLVIASPDSRPELRIRQRHGRSPGGLEP